MTNKGKLLYKPPIPKPLIGVCAIFLTLTILSIIFNEKLPWRPLFFIAPLMLTLFFILLAYSESSFSVYENGVKPNSIVFFTTQFIPFDRIKGVYKYGNSKSAYLIHFTSPNAYTLKSTLGDYNFTIEVKEEEKLFGLLKERIGHRWATVFRKDIIVKYDYADKKLKLVNVDEEKVKSKDSPK